MYMCLFVNVQKYYVFFVFFYLFTHPLCTHLQFSLAFNESQSTYDGATRFVYTSCIEYLVVLLFTLSKKE